MNEYGYGALVRWLHKRTVQILGADGFSDYIQSL